MQLVVILSNLCFVYCQWYLGEEKQQATTTSIDTEDSSKSIPAQSPTQCVLKCQRHLKEGYYVKQKGQCFCLKDEEQRIYAKEDNAGILYHQFEVTQGSLLLLGRRIADWQWEMSELRPANGIDLTGVFDHVRCSFKNRGRFYEIK